MAAHSFLDKTLEQISRDRVNDNVQLMSLQATNPDQELLRKILKDQQLGKERFEDM